MQTHKIQNRLLILPDKIFMWGIDNHYKTWMVSVYSDEFELKTCGQEPDVDRLENYLHKHYPNANLRLALRIRVL